MFSSFLVIMLVAMNHNLNFSCIVISVVATVVTRNSSYAPCIPIFITNILAFYYSNELKRPQLKTSSLTSAAHRV